MAKTSIDQWDASAGNNTDVAGINIDEGMAPSDVNNALRATMAQLKVWYDQEHVGQVKWFAYAGPSGNWLACDGTAYDSVTDSQYAPLYAKIGTSFGGSGPSDFKVPDLRGRAPMGAGQGDTAEGGGSGTSRSLGDKAGKETHTLALGELPAHDHGGATSTDGVHTHAQTVYNEVAGQGSGGNIHSDPGTGTTGAAGSHSHTISQQGGDSDHTIVGPRLVLQAYIGY